MWLVVCVAGVCGLLGFSEAALTSLAGYDTNPDDERRFDTNMLLFRMAVIGLYTSYATPILLRITSGRNKFTPGPFSLGRWGIPLGYISVAWVSFIIVLLMFPPSQSVDAEDMSTCMLNSSGFA